MLDFFSSNFQEPSKAGSHPALQGTVAKSLAAQLRPSHWDDVLGQEHLTDETSGLRALITADRYSGIILWGPPGTGKTSLAGIIGKSSGHEMVALSATTSGIKDFKDVINQSERNLERGGSGKGLLLFVDEIHRLAKNQQDVFLPALEQGLIKLVGATTENPSFEVNRAVLSRVLVFPVKLLHDGAMRHLMDRAVDALSKDLKNLDGMTLDEDARRFIIAAACGDARKAHQLIEGAYAVALAHSNLQPHADKTIHIDGATVVKASGQIAPAYDKQADLHYDLASAMIKCIRAGKTDAALYYMARMLVGGEDIMFIARRLVIAASEDIGNANPHGLVLASTAMQAVHLVGMPEARIILGQVVTYLAESPKSNHSYLAIKEAMEDASKYPSESVPLFLRNGVSKLMRDQGYGKGYIYPHDDPEGSAQLEYMPPPLRGRCYYNPSPAKADATTRGLP